MTVQELFELFTDMLDDVADAAAETDPRWAFDPFFLRELNRAENLAAQNGKLLWDQDTASVCQVTMEDGTRGYTLSPLILQLEKVWYQDIPLEKTKRDAFEGALPDDTGEPTQFFVRNRTLYLNPIPGTAEDAQTLTLGVYRLPLVPMADYADVPEIDAQYHEGLLEWVKYRALMRLDEDTEAKQEALLARAEFERIFGKAVSADVMRHQLEEPRKLAFGHGSYFG